ncbi:MAG: nucleotidyltransferase domain-containing protein [Selenomonadaceae bacterium]|nr:nucleotidyltransferase domain-containing protein [Selenomonadaceae bacterium]
MWRAFAKPFKNINYIFPTQQQAVHDMVEVCRKDENIKKVIVFGSSVTAGCHPWSDIDIYYEMEREPKKYPVILSDTAFDNWSNFSVDENLLAEINRTGVVVYERK